MLRPLANSRRLDEQGKYRMAYAAFRAGRSELATALLEEIPSASTKTQLRAAIDACVASPWSCW